MRVALRQAQGPRVIASEAWQSINKKAYFYMDCHVLFAYALSPRNDEHYKPWTKHSNSNQIFQTSSR